MPWKSPSSQPTSWAWAIRSSASDGSASLNGRAIRSSSAMSSGASPSFSSAMERSWMSASRARPASSSGALRTSSRSCLTIEPMRITLAGCSTRSAGFVERGRGAEASSASPGVGCGATPIPSGVTMTTRSPSLVTVVGTPRSSSPWSRSSRGCSLMDPSCNTARAHSSRVPRWSWEQPPEHTRRRRTEGREREGRRSGWLTSRVDMHIVCRCHRMSICIGPEGDPMSQSAPHPPNAGTPKSDPLTFDRKDRWGLAILLAARRGGHGLPPGRPARRGLARR